MILRKMLVGGAAIAAMALMAASMPASVPGFVSPAQADVDVSISVGTFYDELSPYGDWVNYDNNYVFVPAGADPRWKPYTRGRWEYTKRYGWVWVSDERHGWATHHYGRWGYGPGIGWYWVPDTRWGPAWVDWRRDDDYVAWAPLAPGGDGVTVTIGAGAPAPLPDYYWAAVAAPNFLAPNLAINIIDRDDRAYEVVRRARPMGYVRYRDNVVVNNFIDIDYVERRTRKKVVVRDVRDARNRDEAGRRSGNELAIYNPRVERKGDAKPRKAETVDQVARKKRAENPEFSKRVEEREKRHALKRETQEGDKASENRKEKREKAKEAKQQPAEETATKRSDEQAAKKKAREERAAKQREEQDASKKREERKRQQNEEAKASDDGQTGKQKERKAKKQENEKAQAEKSRKKQQEDAQPARKQQEKTKKKQQQQETRATDESDTAKTGARAEGEAKKKKKNQTVTQ